MEDNKEPRRLQPVVKASPVIEKRSLASRVYREFIKDDATEIKNHIVYDVLVPTIRGAIESSLHNVVSIVFGGSPYKPNYNSSNTSSGRVIDRVDRVIHDYTSSSKNNYSRPMDSYRPINPYNIEELKWRNYSDAQYVLKSMRDTIIQYGNVSINDMYDLGDPDHSRINFRDIPPEACKWGWVNLSTAKVGSRNGYFVLELPNPIAIK